MKTDITQQTRVTPNQPLYERRTTPSNWKKICHRLAIISNFEQMDCDFLNPLNSKLNPICYLLALLGAHHVSPR